MPVGIVDGDCEGSKVLIVKFPLNFPLKSSWLLEKATVIGEVSGRAILKGTFLLLVLISVHSVVFPPNVILLVT